MPRRSVQQYLYDILGAADKVRRFTHDMELDAYLSDERTISAVERQLTIVGEALAQLAKVDAEMARSIPELQRIIGFRNVLVHGYAVVNQRVVWNACKVELPVLERQVRSLLESLGPAKGA